MLASVTVDIDITQLADGNKGVHAMIPKSIFARGK
jgi:acetamidase/formamidase